MLVSLPINSQILHPFPDLFADHFEDLVSFLQYFVARNTCGETSGCRSAGCGPLPDRIRKFVGACALAAGELEGLG